MPNVEFDLTLPVSQRSKFCFSRFVFEVEATIRYADWDWFFAVFEDDLSFQLKVGRSVWIASGFVRLWHRSS